VREKNQREVPGKEAHDMWPQRTDIDAWITYRSWHVKLGDSSGFVRLPPGERLLRATPIAVASLSRRRDEARAFIEFLKSDRGHQIFRKWGWE